MLFSRSEQMNASMHLEMRTDRKGWRIFKRTRIRIAKEGREIQRNRKKKNERAREGKHLKEAQ